MIAFQSASTKWTLALSQLKDHTEVLNSVIHHHGVSREITSGHWIEFVETEGFSAVIFDCDGTLVESSAAHMKSMQAAAREQGVEMSEEWYLARTGLDRASLLLEFQDSIRTVFDVERASKTSIEHFGKFASMVLPKKGVLGFARDPNQRGISLAVATNAERDVAEVSLNTTGVRTIFSYLVSISDGVAPKPSPEMFLRAADRVGQAQNNVLVVEDSPQGVRAAFDAGMSVIQLT